MGRFFLILAALLALPTVAFAQARGVADPRAFVARTYAAYQRGPDSPIEWPTYAYSPRLRALFRNYDRWAHANGELVGTLDFDWWINAQDWELHDVAVTERANGPRRRTVTARFRNIDRAEEIRFLFVRLAGRWYLDDAVEGSGRGDDGWTLSALLRAGVAEARALRR